MILYVRGIQDSDSQFLKVDSHVVIRNNTERSHIPFTQLPLNGNTLQIYGTVSQPGYR